MKPLFKNGDLYGTLYDIAFFIPKKLNIIKMQWNWKRSCIIIRFLIFQLSVIPNRLFKSGVKLLQIRLQRWISEAWISHSHDICCLTVLIVIKPGFQKSSVDTYILVCLLASLCRPKKNELAVLQRACLRFLYFLFAFSLIETLAFKFYLIPEKLLTELLPHDVVPSKQKTLRLCILCR